MDKALVTALGLLLIYFIYWFFMGKKEKVIKAQGEIDIVVEGGYNPNTIEINKNQSTKINFLRKDPSSCLEEVVIPDFKVRKTLPLGETVTITLNPKVSGNFEFSCGMNMYHGRLIVN